MSEDMRKYLIPDWVAVSHRDLSQGGSIAVARTLGIADRPNVAAGAVSSGAALSAMGQGASPADSWIGVSNSQAPLPSLDEKGGAKKDEAKASRRSQKDKKDEAKSQTQEAMKEGSEEREKEKDKEKDKRPKGGDSPPAENVSAPPPKRGSDLLEAPVMAEHAATSRDKSPRRKASADENGEITKKKSDRARSPRPEKDEKKGRRSPRPDKYGIDKEDRNRGEGSANGDDDASPKREKRRRDRGEKSSTDPSQSASASAEGGGKRHSDPSDPGAGAGKSSSEVSGAASQLSGTMSAREPASNATASVLPVTAQSARGNGEGDALAEFSHAMRAKPAAVAAVAAVAAPVLADGSRSEAPKSKTGGLPSGPGAFLASAGAMQLVPAAAVAPSLGR